MADGIEVSELLVAAGGALYVAPYGTTLPSDIDAALDSAFDNLGLISEDGIDFETDISVETIMAWQRFYAVRRIVSGRDATLACELMQWDGNTLTAAFGGGTIAATANGHIYRPPQAQNFDELSLVLQAIDGTRNYRLVFERCMVIDNGTTNFVRANTANLPVTFGVIGDEDGSGNEQSWYVLSDDSSLGEWDS